MEEVDLIRARIAKVERDRAHATSKAESHRKKADEYEREAGELDILLRHLNDWIADAGKEKTPAPDARTVSQDEGASESIRSLVRTAIQRNPVFSTSQLVSAVQARIPNALEKSIHAELSYANTRGDVTRIETGKYKSNLYTKPPAPRPPSANTAVTQEKIERDPFADTELDDPFKDDDPVQGEKHELSARFGRVQ